MYCQGEAFGPHCHIVLVLVSTDNVVAFWKQRAHTLVIFLDVSWHRNIDCAVNIIPLQRNAIIQSAGRVLDEGIPGL